MTDAQRPIEEYLLAGVFWVLLVTAPIVTLWNVFGAVFTVIFGLLGFYIITTVVVKPTDTIWELHSYLRADRPWAYRVGLGSRFVAILSVALAVLVDFVVFEISNTVKGGFTVLFAGLIVTMIAVTMSQVLGADIDPPTT